MSKPNLSNPMLATIDGIDAKLALLEKEVRILDEEYKENLEQKERLSAKKEDKEKSVVICV